MRKPVLLILFLMCNGWPVLAANAIKGFSADYQLMFNDEKVGQTFFSLELREGQQYSFEVFTLPTGELAAGAEKLEVLEASNGQLRDGLPVPNSYYYAVRTKSGTELLEFFYDWKKMQLTIRSNEKQERIGLASGTQDRLSYLLYAMNLGLNHKSQAEFPLSSPDNTAKTRLRLKTKQYTNLPAGRFLLQEVEQYRGGGSKPDRTLWLAADKGYIPALVENRNGKGVVRMELLRLTR